MRAASAAGDVGNAGVVGVVLREMLTLTGPVAVAAAVLIALAAPWLAAFLHLASPAPMLLCAGAVALTPPGRPGPRGALRSRRRRPSSPP